MLSKQFLLPIARELVIDLFAGGGGASTGIELALGRHVDIAVNHDPQAISLHQRNHPQTRHFCSDVFEVDPLTVTDGQPVGLLWASPDCKHFSKAKGGKPVSKKVRGLAWVVTKWARLVQPRVICLENVEEFKDWGPLDENNMPDAAKKGRTFKRWKRSLELLGYVVEHRELRACDYGAPTIRKRLFLVARNDGAPIVWPAATHSKLGGNGLKPWRTAAECIDWELPVPSIFERKKPLAEATLRRIAHGIQRYVIDAAKPFIVPVTHQGDNRVHGIDEPMRTVTTARRGEFALVSPVIVKNNFGSKPSHGVDEPLHTVTTQGNKHALVSAHLTKFRQGSKGRSMAEPMPTVTANSFIKRPGGAPPLGVVAATLVGLAHSGDGPRGSGIEAPVSTIHAGGGNHAVVSATLIQTGYGERPGQAPRVPGLDKPLGTCVDGVKAAVVAATLIKHFGGKPQVGKTHTSVENPMPTVTACDHSSIAAATLVKLRGTSNSADVDAPLATVSAGGTHHAAVYAFLVKYFGTNQDPRLDEPMHTATTKGRFALVTIKGEPYYIADIGLRMLKPRELFNAQSFPKGYEITHGADGAAITQEAQIRMCGNSVAPVMACAMVTANYGAGLADERKAA